MGLQARITGVAQQVADALAVSADPAAAVTVERVYAPEFLDPDFWKDNPNLAQSFAGRKVYVFAATERQDAPATRGEDFNDYGIVVIVLERYTAAGDVPNDWLDDRVAWVEEAIYDMLGDARTDTLAVPDAIPVTQEWTQVYSPDLLRQLKLFRSEVTVVFRRVEEG